ncbi:MAG: O-antigen ligase family protein [Pseudomonadota bacterium]
MQFIERIRTALRAVIFWSALVGVLFAALALGANRPISWTALWAGSAVLFAALILVDAGSQDAARAWRRALPVIILWVAVLIWGLVQAGPAPVASWAHPAWTDAAAIGALEGVTRQTWPWSMPVQGAAIASISADPFASLDGVMRLSTYLMVFWIGMRGATDKAAGAAIRAVALFGAALAIYGLAALFADHNPLTGPPAYQGVVTASFINRNAYAYYAGIGAMAALAALALRLPLPRRGESQGAARRALRDLIEAILGGGWIWLAALICLMAALLYTASRAGTVASLIGMAVLLAMTLGKRSAAWRWGMLLVLLLPVLALSIGAEGLLNRLLLKDPTEDGRAALFAQIFIAIENKPWLGHGLGAFQDAFRPYTTYELAIGEWGLAHSAYLENAFELGLPATAALCLAIGLVMVRLWRGIQTRRRQRPIPALGLALLVAGALHSTVDFSLQMPATAALVALLAGIGYARSWRDEMADMPKRPQKRRRAESDPNSSHPEVSATENSS